MLRITDQLDSVMRPMEYHVYDNMQEFLEEIRRVPEGRAAKHDHTANPAFAGRDFGGSWDAVYAAVNEPWEEGIEMLEQMLEQLDAADLPQPVSRRRKVRYNEDDGDELDYDRVRCGQPYWRASRRQNTRGPQTITIVIDVTTPHYEMARDILWRGAAAIALAKRLEEAGYRVELWAVNTTSGLWDGNTTGFIAVRLKRPSDPIDCATLVSAVSGWAYRTLWFRSMLVGHSRVSSHLGSCRLPRDKELDQISRDPERILVAGAFNYTDALAQVRAALERITSK